MGHSRLLRITWLRIPMPVRYLCWFYEMWKRRSTLKPWQRWRGRRWRLFGATWTNHTGRLSRFAKTVRGAMNCWYFSRDESWGFARLRAFLGFNRRFHLMCDHVPSYIHSESSRLPCCTSTTTSTHTHTQTRPRIPPLLFRIDFLFSMFSLLDSSLSDVFDIRTSGLPHFNYQRREFATKASSLTRSFLDPNHPGRRLRRTRKKTRKTLHGTREQCYYIL